MALSRFHWPDRRKHLRDYLSSYWSPEFSRDVSWFASRHDEHGAGRKANNSLDGVSKAILRSPAIRGSAHNNKIGPHFPCGLNNFSVSKTAPHFRGQTSLRPAPCLNQSVEFCLCVSFQV